MDPENSDSTASAAVGKVCAICGANLAGARRVKGPEGKYFCYECGLNYQRQKLQEEGAPCADCNRLVLRSEMFLSGGKYYCDRCYAERMSETTGGPVSLARDPEGEVKEKRVRNKKAIAAFVGLELAVVLFLLWYFELIPGSGARPASASPDKNPVKMLLENQRKDAPPQRTPRGR